MKSSKLWMWVLIAAGLLQIGMAIAHFGLQYEWRGVDGGSLPPQLRWALFALNFSWSTIVLGIGALTIYAARLRPDVQFIRATLIVLSVFWTVHGIYMIVMPMPVPARLAWIQGPIVAFPATVITLLLLALVASRSQRLASTVPLMS